MMENANRDLIDEIRALRNEMTMLKVATVSTASHTDGILQIHRRWNGEGLPPDRMDYQQRVADATERTADAVEV
jgi:hypothetical protein